MTVPRSMRSMCSGAGGPAARCARDRGRRRECRHWSPPAWPSRSGVGLCWSPPPSYTGSARTPGPRGLRWRRHDLSRDGKQLGRREPPTGSNHHGSVHRDHGDVPPAALHIQPERLPAITARCRRAGYAATGRLGPGPGWCWLTRDGITVTGLRFPAVRLSLGCLRTSVGADRAAGSGTLRLWPGGAPAGPLPTRRPGAAVILGEVPELYRRLYSQSATRHSAGVWSARFTAGRCPE